MTIEEALVQILKADATLAGLVAGRVYPQDAPQDAAAPLVVYSTADFDQQMTLTGYDPTFNCAARFDCYGGGEGGSYASAKAVSGAVRDALTDFFRGAVEGSDGGLTVEGIVLDGGEDGQEVPLFGEEEALDYVGVSVRVYWRTGTGVAA